jgi:hypothetical protein
MRQSCFQEFVEWLLDNLFYLVTIFVAGSLVIKYQIYSPTSNDIPAIVTWILIIVSNPSPKAFAIKMATLRSDEPKMKRITRKNLLQHLKLWNI